MKLPQEFSERMKLLLGEEYEEFLKTYEEPRRYGLRVNTLKISAEEFERIAPFPVERLPWISNGYWYEKRGEEPSRHPFYYAGLYYLQEPSAMTPANVLPVEPGDRVLDLCAAPGGKATALAAKLKGEGLLVANDISASRAKALLKNLEVFGVTNAFVTNAAPPKLADQFPLFFDKILVDAPCSGEGMFRKDAANARAWSTDKVDACAKVQKGILRSAVAMLRPGGMLLYSTCTFAPEEDEQAAAYLLREFPEMELCDIPWYEGFSHGRPEVGKESRFGGPEAEEESWREDEALRFGRPELGKESWREDEALRFGGPEAEEESWREDEALRFSRPEAGKESWREDEALRFGGPEAEEESWREDEAFRFGRPEAGKESWPGNGQNFQASNDGIFEQLEKCVRIFPHKMRGEGHFLALFRKKEQSGKNLSENAGKERKNLSGTEMGNGARGGSPAKKAPSREEWKILQEFLRDVREDFPNEQIEIRKGQVYLVPEALPQVQGIPFLRNGLYMGEIRKGRFEPSQSFAMALKGDGYASVITLSSGDERVYRYLKGETIDVDDIMPARAGGWQLVCVAGYPLGWGKLTNGRLKNKYHSGWRM